MPTRTRRSCWRWLHLLAGGGCLCLRAQLASPIGHLSSKIAVSFLFQRILMRTSRFFLATLKEAPSDAEVISHQLMVRAGMIKRLAGGIYTWMPLGLARAAQGGEDRARGDGSCRGDRIVDAGGATGRAVAGIRSLGEIWSRVAALQGSPPARFRHWPDARRSDYRRRAQGRQELPPATASLLPGAGQVPRRNSAALRDHAWPRVPDEGRLFLPQQFRRPAARIPQHVRNLYAASSLAWD
jgi:hypothetical protein